MKYNRVKSGLIRSALESIPTIGKYFTSERGEIGVDLSYRIRPPQDPQEYHAAITKAEKRVKPSNNYHNGNKGFWSLFGWNGSDRHNGAVSREVLEPYINQVGKTFGPDFGFQVLEVPKGGNGNAYLGHLEPILDLVDVIEDSKLLELTEVGNDPQTLIKEKAPSGGKSRGFLKYLKDMVEKTDKGPIKNIPPEEMDIYKMVSDNRIYFQSLYEDHTDDFVASEFLCLDGVKNAYIPLIMDILGRQMSHKQAEALSKKMHTDGKYSVRYLLSDDYSNIVLKFGDCTYGMKTEGKEFAPESQRLLNDKDMTLRLGKYLSSVMSEKARPYLSQEDIEYFAKEIMSVKGCGPAAARDFFSKEGVTIDDGQIKKWYNQLRVKNNGKTQQIKKYASADEFVGKYLDAYEKGSPYREAVKTIEMPGNNIMLNQRPFRVRLLREEDGFLRKFWKYLDSR